MRRLGVTITTADTCEILTGRTGDINIKNVSPGGYASVETEIPRDLAAPVYKGATIRVYDTVTGETACEGRIIEQGRGNDGTWSLSALGTGLAALDDRDEPYMIVDSELSPIARETHLGTNRKWEGGSKRRNRKKGGIIQKAIKPYKVITSINTGKVEVSPAPNGTDLEGLLYAIPEGTTHVSAATIIAEFRGPAMCGQKLGAYRFRYLCGVNNGWFMRSDAATVGGTSDTWSQTWSTTSPAGVWKVHGTDFDSARNMFRARIVTGASSTVGLDVWAHVRNLYLRSQLLDKNGNTRPGADHATTTVYAHDVFCDIVKRRTNLAIDNVTNGTTGFRQLTWYEGATPREILDDILEGDPTVTYHAWDNGTISLDPTIGELRYQFDARHGFESPAPTTEVYGGVIVTGVDENGFPRRYELTRDPAGRTTTFEMAETWESSSAQAAAELFLDNHAAPPNAGTLTVVEPVMDLQTGRLVEPFMIRAGSVCSVNGFQGSPSPLSAAVPVLDGATVFRIVSVAYSTADGAAVLELDTNTFDVDRAVVELLK